MKIKIYILIFLLLIAPWANVFAASSEGVQGGSNVLMEAMRLMNEKKFGEAKKLLRGAIEVEPRNELLWVSYDSCVRSDLFANDEPSAKMEAPKDVRNMPEADISFPPAESRQEAGDGAAGTGETVIECAMLQADFSAGTARGDLTCILTDSFKFINADGGSYLMLSPKQNAAMVSFSFDVKKFPKKIILNITQRLVKKDRFVSAAPVVIEANEKRVNYDSVKIGNKIDTSEFDITNLCKGGANIITLTIEKSKYPYLLKNVKIIQRFKD